MNGIAHIESLLEMAKRSLVKYEDQLVQIPSSLFYIGLVRNTKAQIKELSESLINNKKVREKEIVELRLIGKQADYGTLPLDVIGKLSSAFAEALIYASKQVQVGNKKSSGILTQIKKSLDLRFAGVAPGSTRIFITGNTNPDLFGRSLMEESLENTFGLFSSEDSQGLLDFASKCGTQSIKSFKTFLNAIEVCSLELNISWNSALAKEYSWVGDKNKINQLANSLSHIVSEQPVIHNIEGVLITSSLRGNFEIKGIDKKTYKGTYPVELLEKVREIRIGEDCMSVIEEARIVNSATKQSRSVFTLKSVSRLEG